MFLELAGHHVAVAHSGEEGLSRANEVTPEVVLCDLGLPSGMSGLDVARELRARHADSIALVALTGHSGAEILQQVKEAGFDQHVVKPVDPRALSKIVEQA